jgi:hypothetical protein
MKILADFTDLKAFFDSPAAVGNLLDELQLFFVFSYDHS